MQIDIDSFAIGPGSSKELQDLQPEWAQLDV